MPHPLLLDLTLPTPAENLALDEALLLAADERADRDREVLRFWESDRLFVALGVASRRAADVHLEACAQDDVPVLRRASGGGTVLQGPGCLNYALILSLEARPELRDVTRGYRVILERVASTLGVPGLAAAGTSDLATGGQKVSGSAQKRLRRYILHHGTILHGFDLSLIERYLREPEKQPDYRARRPHAAFVRNVELSPADVRARIAAAFDAAAPLAPPRLPDLATLIREKYSSPAWNERF